MIRTELTLPQSNQGFEQISDLKQKIKSVLSLVSLSSETARRETLVSPILLEAIIYCQCQLRIEYPLNVNPWLKGNLDYLLRSNNSVVLIEARKDNLSRGFIQLAVELIALSQVEAQEIFYGAVTIGNIWQFAKLDTREHHIIQDLNLFKIPDDLEPLVKVLIGILEGVD